MHKTQQSTKSKDKVRGLLINKLKKKFGNSSAASEAIETKVVKFLSQSRITEANLRKLEQEIMISLNPTKERSKESLHSKSLERKGKYREVPKKKVYEKDMSVNHGKSPKAADEERDWNAIHKFNAELHMEEILQDEERRRLERSMMKEILQQQEREKKEIDARMKEEQSQYQHRRLQHLKLIDLREEQWQKARKEYVLREKERLERQVREEAVRKRREQETNMKCEQEYVQRVQKEMHEEREAVRLRKEMEREYNRKLMMEAELSKKRQIEELRMAQEKERKEMLSYAKVQEQQEASQKREAKERELKAQSLMSQMANSTIKSKNRQREEEANKILQYQREKELRDKLDEEERLRYIDASKREMRSFLFQQMEEKARKELEERRSDVRQAEMWRKDAKLHVDQERMVRQKVLSANKEHAEYLKRQMAAERKERTTVMDNNEYLMNKKTLESINARKKLDAIY